MVIRALQESDIEEIKRIHSIYFADKFPFPDFFNKFLCAFVVEDEGNIITAGGVRTIAEAILVTNLSFTARERREALLHCLSAGSFVAEKHGYDSIHAFVEDEKWRNQLFRYGFRPCKGEALVIHG